MGYTLFLKGSYYALLQVVELKCVLAVCVHNHPIIIQIHPVFFLSTKIFTLFLNRAICQCDVTRTEAPPMSVDWQ